MKLLNKSIITKAIALTIFFIGGLLSNPMIINDSIYLPEGENGNEIMAAHEYSHLKYHNLTDNQKKIVDAYIDNFGTDNSNPIFSENYRTSKYSFNVDNSIGDCLGKVCKKGEWKQLMIDSNMDSYKYFFCKMSEKCINDEAQAFTFQDKPLARFKIEALAGSIGIVAIK